MEITEKQRRQGLSKGGIPRKEIMKRVRHSRSLLTRVQDNLVPIIETYGMYGKEAHMELLISVLEVIEMGDGFLSDLEKFG